MKYGDKIIAKLIFFNSQIPAYFTRPKGDFATIRAERQAALVEQFIDGREFSVGILAGEVLPILEIDFSTLPDGLERFYSYRVKHSYGSYTRYICPAQINEDLQRKIIDYALKAFKILGLRNYARIDLRVKENHIYFLEVNSLPMLTEKPVPQALLL